MTFEEFERIQQDLHTKILGMTKTKGVEYAGKVDRLNNFKAVGAKVGITPEVALGVFLDKHLRAIYHYIKTGETLSEDIEGRIVDAILYLELLLGLHVERVNSDEFTRRDPTGVPL